MRKNFFKATALIMMVCGVAACQSEKKTEKGATYTVVKNGDGAALHKGEFVLVNLKLFTPDDSMAVSTDEYGPMAFKCDSSWDKRGSFFDVLKGSHKGDSVNMELYASDFYSTGFRRPVPSYLKALDKVNLQFSVKDILDSAAFDKWQQQMMQKFQQKQAEQQATQKKEDIASIEAYLKDNGIEAQKTEDGLYYVINEKGNGDQPASGDIVSVDYTGMLLDSGKVFDSSIPEDAKEAGIYNEKRDYKPIQFPVGQGRVIPGWDEGISLLHKGDKATFYIPSTLGYGSRGAGGVIPPNAILKFNVHLVDVKHNENKDKQ